jgi:hypothetical protein
MVNTDRPLRVAFMSATMTPVMWGSLGEELNLNISRDRVVQAPIDRVNLTYFVERRRERVFTQLEFLVAALKKTPANQGRAWGPCPKTLILCASYTLASAVFDYFAKALRPAGHKDWNFSDAAAEKTRPFDKIYGGRPRDLRDAALLRFRVGTIVILIATAIGEHGVDFRDVTVVVHWGTSGIAPNIARTALSLSLSPLSSYFCYPAGTLHQLVQGDGRGARPSPDNPDAIGRAFCLSVVNGTDMVDKRCGAGLRRYYRLGLVGMSEEKASQGADEWPCELCHHAPAAGDAALAAPHKRACLRRLRVEAFGQQVAVGGPQGCLCCGVCRRACNCGDCALPERVPPWAITLPIQDASDPDSSDTDGGDDGDGE